jgi:hypothetical protein
MPHFLIVVKSKAVHQKFAFERIVFANGPCCRLKRPLIDLWCARSLVYRFATVTELSVATAEELASVWQLLQWRLVRVVVALGK